MMQYVEYNQRHQTALDILGKMKASLDNYTAKPNHNEKWANDRLEMIIGLAKFMQCSERTIQELETETDEAFHRGFQKGKRQHEAPHQAFREVFTLFDALQLTQISRDILTKMTKSIKTDEFKRTISKEAAKKKWPECY